MGSAYPSAGEDHRRGEDEEAALHCAPAFGAASGMASRPTFS